MGFPNPTASRGGRDQSEWIVADMQRVNNVEKCGKMSEGDSPVAPGCLGSGVPRYLDSWMVRCFDPWMCWRADVLMCFGTRVLGMLGCLDTNTRVLESNGIAIKLVPTANLIISDSRDTRMLAPTVSNLVKRYSTILTFSV